MSDTLISVAVFVIIVSVSAFLTRWFAGAMYNHCHSCGTLNARRRSECRACGQVLKKT